METDYEKKETKKWELHDGWKNGDYNQSLLVVVWVAIFRACEGMVRVDLEADAVW